jgi:hypothetical protein
LLLLSSKLTLITLYLADDYGSTDSHAAPQIIKDKLASLSASETFSKISNELHFGHSEGFEETSPAVNIIEDDSVSSPDVSQGPFVSESNVIEEEKLPFSEPVVGLKQNFDCFDVPPMHSETFMKDKETHSLIKNQTTFEALASAVDMESSPVDSPLNLTLAISESSLPLVEQNISDTPLSFTETRESLSHTENTNNNFSIESTNTMSNLQDKLNSSVPEPISFSKTLVIEKFPQVVADSITSENSFESTSEIVGEPQPDLSEKAANNFDLTPKVSRFDNDTDLPVSGDCDLELKAETDTSKDSFESSREIEPLSQHLSIKKLTSAPASPKNSNNIHERPSESEIEESVIVTSLGNVIPPTITGLANTASDFAIDTTASFGATDSVKSKPESLPLADMHELDANAGPENLTENEAPTSPVDSISSNDSFASASEAIDENARHFVKSSDRDQLSPEVTTNEAESDSINKTAIIETATATAVGAVAFVSLTDNSPRSAFSEQEIGLQNESELPSTVNTVPVLSINDNVLGSPVSFTVSKDPLMSTSEATFDALQQSPLERSFENSQQSRNLKFDNAELVDPTPNLPSTVRNAHTSPVYLARSPGAAIWTPAPSSTDSSPVLEPWSPKEVHFSLPNSPVAATGLTDPVPLNGVKPLQLSDIEDSSSNQLIPTENQFDVSKIVESDPNTLDFASRKIDDESKIDSLESSVIEQINSVPIHEFNNLSKFLSFLFFFSSFFH